MMDKRYGKVKWGKNQNRRRTSEANWKLPLKWNRQIWQCDGCSEWRFLDPILTHADMTPKNTTPCLKCKRLESLHLRRPRVFCASLADWLDNEVPIEWLADLLKLIHDTPNLDWLLLTKRPENWRKRVHGAREIMFHQMMEKAIGDPETIPYTHRERVRDCVAKWLEQDEPPANVWIGTTVENQEMADKRIPELLKIPAKVRFLSCEPLLSTIALPLQGDGHDNPSLPGIHWVITGGESGPNARPSHPDWHRSARDQCRAAGVAFFMKQMGGVRDKRGRLEDLPEDLRRREFPHA